MPETSLRNFAPALAHMLPGWFERTSDRAPDLVFLAEGVLLLLRLLAGARGVVLGLEDLQWADPESLALVEYLAENAGTERLVLVATVRDDQLSAPPVSLRELAAWGGVRWLELGRLAQDEVLRLAAARLGGAVPASVSQLLQVTAEGLPLFVEELLGGLIAAGALRRQGEEWQAADRVDLHLPSSFVASVEERVAALTHPTQVVLASAAVLGRSFDTALLSACTCLPSGDVSAALHACARRRGAGRGEVGPSGVPGVWCGPAVGLAELAGRDDRAVALLRVASERARNDGALGAAVEALERAVVLADESAQRVVQLELFESLVAAGRFERARELGERLSSASRRG